MGVPARKIDTQPSRGRKVRPRVALVPTRSTKRARKCDSAAIVKQNFGLFVAVTLVLCGLGLGRVWLSVQAAEASLDAGQLRSDIKAERYRGDMLEIQQSALSSPSRIRAIAGATMDMVPTGDVTYIDLEPASVALKSMQGDRTTAFGRALSDALTLAAGEAQVLLVGDVGLASAR